MFIIPEFWKQREEGQEFKANLRNTMILMLSGVHETPTFKKIKTYDPFQKPEHLSS